jgi:hypothetical protein
MNLQDEIKKALEDSGPRLAQDSAFQSLQEFYREKIQAGVALKHDYSLPPLDTVGRGIHAFYRADSDNSRQRNNLTAE